MHDYSGTSNFSALFPNTLVIVVDRFLVRIRDEIGIRLRHPSACFNFLDCRQGELTTISVVDRFSRLIMFAFLI